MNSVVDGQILPYSGGIVNHPRLEEILPTPYTALVKTPLQTGDLQDRLAEMLKSALGYAAMGIPVFPCHVPIFDKNGVCVGCTCEDYRHSDPTCKKPLGEDERCDSPGKCPAINFFRDATTDEATIREWFKKPWKKFHPAAGYHHFVPNLAARCDDLVIIDHDRYKAEYAGHELLHMAGTDTPMLHARGSQAWFSMPAGFNLGMGTGSLPGGCDVRAGASAYAMLPPSQHWTGVQHEWDENFSLFGMELAPLPQAILDLLPTGKAPAALVVFGAAVDCPDLGRLRLKQEILDLLHHGHEAADRSTEVPPKEWKGR